MIKETMKNRAIFLDRDGVINREIGRHVFDTDSFVINDGVFEALSLLKNSGYMLIVISNQSGIARGLYTHGHVSRIHEMMTRELAAKGIELDEIYYCPHHPSAGKCLCRKPGSLMIEKAIARFNIDPRLSWMAGDRERDIEAARRVGIRGILIDSNDNLMKHIEKIINDDLSGSKPPIET
jgi:D-glycero-D-manno-heptose 1,7-bisphosphate phosphatase